MSAPALLAVGAASMAIAVGVITAASALDASARASGAADAAALAAADAALGWIAAEPCALAAEVVIAVGVTLESCDADSVSGQVRVSVSVQTMFGRVVARARAAPPGA
jgi:hypothetical protein